MLRHALACVLHAVANRIEPERQVEVRYVYYTVPTTTTPPTYQWWSPTTTTPPTYQWWSPTTTTPPTYQWWSPTTHTAN